MRPAILRDDEAFRLWLSEILGERAKSNDDQGHLSPLDMFLAIVALEEEASEFPIELMETITSLEELRTWILVKLAHKE